MKKRTLSDYPELLKEWHPILNGDINPHEIAARSKIKVWWKCEKRGHEWETICFSRIYGKSGFITGCPYCSNRFACKDNCLATTHPELAKEFHPTKNNGLTANNVMAGSDKKYWWLCSNNPEHEWEARPDHRTSTRKKTGCPICSESRGEKEVARILDKYNFLYQREFVFNFCKSQKRLRYDFVIKTSSGAKAIEYHGIQHYEPQNFGSSKLSKLCKDKKLEDTQYRDEIKRQWCKSMGIPLLEISYKDFNKIEEQVKEFLDII